jgi:hypothetical protein
MAKEQYAQIGQTALRDPATGEFLPAIPLYARAEDLGGAGASGLTSAEEKALRDVGAIFAKRMKRYIEGGGIVEITRKRVHETEKGKQRDHL